MCVSSQDSKNIVVRCWSAWLHPGASASSLLIIFVKEDVAGSDDDDDDDGEEDVVGNDDDKEEEDGSYSDDAHCAPLVAPPPCPSFLPPSLLQITSYNGKHSRMVLDKVLTSTLNFCSNVS